MTFTQYVREYCRKYGITGYELAKLTGLSTTYCYNLLQGKKDNPSFKVIQTISLELGINYSDFFYGNKRIEVNEKIPEVKEEEVNSISLSDINKLIGLDNIK